MGTKATFIPTTFEEAEEVHKEAKEAKSFLGCIDMSTVTDEHLVAEYYHEWWKIVNRQPGASLKVCSSRGNPLCVFYMGIKDDSCAKCPVCKVTGKALCKCVPDVEAAKEYRDTNNVNIQLGLLGMLEELLILPMLAKQDWEGMAKKRLREAKKEKKV